MPHAGFMTHALALARQAEGRTWPNPMVGCVIVKDGRIIAEGFHRQPGQAHAELDALQNAGEPVRGSAGDWFMPPTRSRNSAANRRRSSSVRNLPTS